VPKPEPDFSVMSERQQVRYLMQMTTR
jgi:hypothetical protein